MAHSHSHAGHHSHDHTHGSGIGTAFALNFAFTIIELAGGVFTNSIAIISDAIHDFGDSISLAMAWYFQRLSKRGSTKQYSYGYKRYSLLGAIVNSVVLLAGSAYILMEAAPRLLTPQYANAKGMFVLAIVGIVANGIAVLRTRCGRSINERVVSLHLLEDVLGWAAVLAGSAVIYFTGWTIIDPILSIAIAIFVIVNVIRNIKQTLPILMQGTPQDVDNERIVAAVLSLENVASVHDLHAWALDERYNVLTLHVVLNNAATMQELSALKAAIRSILRQNAVEHATIEFEEQGSESCAYANCAQTC